MSLDPTYDSVGYQLGRLLAVCESVQYRKSSSRANKTIVDRYFPALSTRPRFVFGPLMRLTELHLSQLRRRGEGTFLRGKLSEILDNISPGALPATLPLDEQALFALGFFHQQRTRWNKDTAAAEMNGATEEPTFWNGRRR